MDPLSAIIKIINFIQDIIGKSDLLPNFAIEEIYTPESIAQNLTFVLKVTNKSSKPYSIDRGYIFKRNVETSKLLTHIKGKIYISEKLNELSKQGKITRVDVEKNLPKYVENAQVAQEVHFASKETKYIIVEYKLSKSEFDYWSNLGVIVADRGLVLKDKIIPATFQSKYEWGITLRDERNNYWMQNLKNQRDFFDFKLLMHFSKFYGNLSFKIERGEPIFLFITRSRISNFFFGLKYRIKKILFYLRLISSM